MRGDIPPSSLHAAMESPTDPIITRFLRKVAWFAVHRPRLLVYPQVLLILFSVFYTISYLEFSTDRNDLVGQEETYHKQFLRFREEFGNQDDLVAIVESDDPSKNRQFVERLGRELNAQTNLFSDIFYRRDLAMLGPKALYFLSETELSELLSTLKEYETLIQTFTQVTNLNGLFRNVNRNFRTAAQPGADTQSLINALPALRRIAAQASAALLPNTLPLPPGIATLFSPDTAVQEPYITFADGQIFVVTTRARDEKSVTAAVEELRRLVLQTKNEVPGVNAGITGEAVLEYDEMRQSQRDSIIATVIALGLVALVFVYAYRETGRPLKATLALVAGLIYTLGYTTLAVGHLNILTVTFVPILVGLAIDFGVHLITRYEEELRHGKAEEQSMEIAMVHTGKGIFTGCLTTAGAFFAMALTDFKGIREMGIITGGGMIICLVPMMTLLPVLLLMGRQNVLDHQHKQRLEKRARIEKLWLNRPALVVGVTLGTAALALTQLPKVYFDYNLLNMQSKGLPAVVFEHKLIQSSSKSVLYAAVLAHSREEALQLEEQIRKLPSVAEVDSMAPVIATPVENKIPLIQEIKEIAARLRFPPPSSTPTDPDALDETLFFTENYLQIALKEVRRTESAQNALQSELETLLAAIRQLRAKLHELPTPLAAQKLAGYEHALFNEIRATFTMLETQTIDSGIRAEDLPEALRRRFIGRSGMFLLQVYPKGDVWERSHQEQFIKELRSVDPGVTGTPIQLYEYTTVLKESYEKAALYALAAIALLVFLHFRSVGKVVLALLPVGIGTIWMAGLMGWFRIPFNPANVMTLPLVIGIGVTNGIHILNRFAEERNPSILAKSTGKAVLVSGLTTVAGFGSLMQAEHQGIASLGIVMVLGVSGCMIAALTFLPALLNCLKELPPENKTPSGDNAQSTLGREEPR